MNRVAKRGNGGSAAALRARVLEERERLALRFPDIPPEDLLLILQSLLRPFGSGRRYFLRRTDSGSYVP